MLKDKLPLCGDFAKYFFLSSGFAFFAFAARQPWALIISLAFLLPAAHSANSCADSINLPNDSQAGSSGAGTEPSQNCDPDVADPSGAEWRSEVVYGLAAAKRRLAPF